MSKRVMDYIRFVILSWDPIRQCLKLHANNVGRFVTVRVSYQTTVFFAVTKPIQYICQIEDSEMLLMNSRSLPHESPLLGRKMDVKPRIDSKSSPKKVVIH